MKNIFKAITGETVLQVKKQTTFRKALINSGIVTEGTNKDWGHKIVRAGLYTVEQSGREITLSPAIEMKF